MEFCKVSARDTANACTANLNRQSGHSNANPRGELTSALIFIVKKIRKSAARESVRKADSMAIVCNRTPQEERNVKAKEMVDFKV